VTRSEQGRGGTDKGTEGGIGGSVTGLHPGSFRGGEKGYRGKDIFEK